MASKLLGLRTVIYPVDDLDRAKQFYSTLLDIQPYFDQPFYVGFNVGGYELGLDPNGAVPTGAHAGPVSYWGVANIDDTFKRSLELGATEHHGVQDVGEGIRVASIADPFGNVIGLIENPHFTLAES
jgi:predicted enzyme related to lactoylglutathione lyase